MQDQQLPENQLFTQSQQLTHYLHEWNQVKPTNFKSNNLKNEIITQKRSRSNFQKKIIKVAQICQVRFPIIQKNTQSLKNLRVPPIPKTTSNARKDINLFSKLPLYKKLNHQNEQKRQSIFKLKNDSLEANVNQINTIKREKKMRRRRNQSDSVNKGVSKDQQLSIDKLKDIVLIQLSKNKNNNNKRRY